jgi:TonB family protein
VVVLSLALVGCGGEEEVRAPRAVPADSSPFEYPVSLWDRGVEGEVAVMVHVTAEGTVDSVFVLETSGEAVLDSAAVAGAYGLEFMPGRRGDRRSAMWVRVPVRFRKPAPAREGAE